jgi:hypothetical protein
MKRAHRKQESVIDFKARIAALMRHRTGADGDRLGLRHAPPALVRKPTDRGYYPPPREERENRVNENIFSFGSETEKAPFRPNEQNAFGRILE